MENTPSKPNEPDTKYGALTASVANELSSFKENRDCPTLRYDMRTAVHEPTHFYNLEVSSKDGDRVEPIGITFDLSGPLSPGQLKYFYIVIGGRTIFSIPISILESIGETNTTPTQHTISFNLTKTYFPKLQLLRLKKTKCVFGVHVGSSENIQAVKIHTSWTYFNLDTRRIEMSSNDYTHRIRQFESVWIGGGTRETYEHTLPFKGTSLGYLIEGDIDSLSRFALTLNGSYLHNLSSEMLFVAGKRLGPRLLSIPFSPCCAGILAQDKIETIRCELTFTKPQESYAVHSMTYNRLIISDGKVSLWDDGAVLPEGKVPDSMVICPDTSVASSPDERTGDKQKCSLAQRIKLYLT